MTRRAAWLAALCALFGCIDTAPGLVVELEDAAVAIRDEGAGEVVRTDLSLFVRVGKYALAGDTFMLPRAQVFVGEELAAQVNLERPADFTGTLEPGESTTVAVTGTVSTEAWPGARAAICGAGSVEVLAVWTAESRPDDPTDAPIMQTGNAVVDTSAIACD
ncbi:MAG: hypothetical protein CMN30_08470 [Sandaracinus sp.]|nr:hypothetical protein [Sandaracinus sp.]